MSVSLTLKCNRNIFSNCLENDDQSQAPERERGGKGVESEDRSKSVICPVQRVLQSSSPFKTCAALLRLAWSCLKQFSAEIPCEMEE